MVGLLENPNFANILISLLTTIGTIAVLWTNSQKNFKDLYSRMDEADKRVHKIAIDNKKKLITDAIVNGYPADYLVLLFKEYKDLGGNGYIEEQVHNYLKET